VQRTTPDAVDDLGAAGLGTQMGSAPAHALHAIARGLPRESPSSEKRNDDDALVSALASCAGGKKETPAQDALKRTAQAAVLATWALSGIG
jgi:hypothetical protein